MGTGAAVADLLRSRGAEDIEHPGGTLFAHLERVEERLARLGGSEVVQRAGPTHAVCTRPHPPIACAPDVLC